MFYVTFNVHSGFLNPINRADELCAANINPATKPSPPAQTAVGVRMHTFAPDVPPATYPNPPEMAGNNKMSL